MTGAAVASGFERKRSETKLVPKRPTADPTFGKTASVVAFAGRESATSWVPASTIRTYA